MACPAASMVVGSLIKILHQAVLMALHKLISYSVVHQYATQMRFIGNTSFKTVVSTLQREIKWSCTKLLDSNCR
jgi:hypothetical protein